MGSAVTGIAIDGLSGMIPAPGLSAAERRELHQRVPGLSFCPATGTTARHTGITLGTTRLPRPAPGDPRALRRVVNAALTIEALRRGAVMLHGAVVARGSEALLILGDYNAGKTRLALALASRGFVGLAGDLALIGARGAVHGGTRAVLTKWPLDAAGRTLPPSDLDVPEGKMRWQAAECAGGPYPGQRIARIVLLSGAAGSGLACEADTVTALCASAARSRRRAMGDEDWRAAQMHEPGLPAWQDTVIASLAAAVPMWRLAADFPECVTQCLHVLEHRPCRAAAAISPAAPM